MTFEQRREKIESYGNAYDRIIQALDEFPREMWQFKPAPEKWSIHEILIHIADSEANSYVRCRRIIAEPGSTVTAYDENVWARELRYHEQSIEDALQLFRYLRAASYNLIRDLPEPVWSHTIEHPENGTMSMEDWLDIYERHIPVHIVQMRRNHIAWREEYGKWEA